MGLFQALFGNKNTEKAKSQIQLFPGDILLLNIFSTAQDLNKIVYPRYLDNAYGITPTERVKILIHNNYIVRASIKDSLSAFALSDLRALCQKYALSTTGKKAELVERLTSCENIEKEILNNMYILSQTGSETLEQNDAILKYHKQSFNIELSEFLRYLKNYGTYENAIKFKLTDEGKRYRINEEWGLFRNTKLNLAHLYANKNDSNQLLYLLETFYCDLSGLGNSNYRDKLKDLMIAPGLISEIVDCKTMYEPCMINECIVDCNLPKHYFSETSFKTVVEYLLESESISLNEVLHIRRSQNKSLSY